MNRPPRLRVLQVVGGLDRAGTETWLRNVLRRSDRSQCEMHFLVHEQRAYSYSDEVKDLGGSVIVCGGAGRPSLYFRNVIKVLRRHGPYDVVHAHLQHSNGVSLLAAQLCGVPVRISHSHNTESVQDRRFPRIIYTALMRQMIAACATQRLAASAAAAEALYGPEWARDPQCSVIFCGIDLDVFKAPAHPELVRRELGLPADAVVLGHVGRFVEQKNHTFLIDVASEAVARNPRVRLLLVGEGEARAAIEHKVNRLGLARHVLFAGSRSDAPRICGAMDVFIFPSLWEGLGLVGLEAQAAGVPVVASEHVPRELSAVPGLVQVLSLNAGPGAWAEAALGAAARPRIESTAAVAAIKHAGFDVATSVKRLFEVYSSCE
jgi:glycosyltransferase involved in cell wall biosynthesis